MVVSISKLTKLVAKSSACKPCRHFHIRLVPHFFSYLGAFWALYSQWGGLHCFRLSITYNWLWNGAQHNTQCLCCAMKGMMHWRWYMWGDVPTTHPPSNPHGLRQIGQVVPSYVKAWGVGQKNPPRPCVGWVDLYSHFNCIWLGQSMPLFPFPCLVRSSRNDSLTLGQDVRPCVWKALSSQKSTPICRGSDLNWNSLDVAKMQATF
jgi:hypothetical protein